LTPPYTGSNFARSTTEIDIQPGTRAAVMPA
jgi:hypothetical protein